MLVPWWALNGQNLTTAQCAKRAERKRRWWMVEDELWESAERSFWAYGRPLDTVTYFKYMGRVLTAV